MKLSPYEEMSRAGSNGAYGRICVPKPANSFAALEESQRTVV